LEAFNAAGGIDKLLLAGKERMTLGANTHTKLGAGGTCVKHGSASASDRGFGVFGMDIWFHGALYYNEFSPMIK
jgi:hypothetical protein